MGLFVFSLVTTAFRQNDQSKNTLTTHPSNQSRQSSSSFKSIEMNNSTILTIAKVKKPWYATRNIVIKKMNQSIPEYQSIKGLNEKFYSFTEDHSFFGGIYFWTSSEEARQWFNTAWFERTKKKYKQPGIVDYYQIKSNTTVKTPETVNGRYWSVLSLYPTDFTIDTSVSGLLKVVGLEDINNKQKGYITLWENEKAARNYFSNSQSVNTYFDTPILIQHAK